MMSAVECQDKVLYTWFANRVAEITDHMDKWERKGILVDKLQHWLRVENIADLATKGRATFKDIKAVSKWQQGPRQLTQHRELARNKRLKKESNSNCVM